MTFEITIADVRSAAARIAPHLPVTATRNYPTLDSLAAMAENGVTCWVKHENHLPTNAFKARNALSLLTTLDPEQRKRGVVAATRGNHGMGLAWAGQLLGIPVNICVPHGNNPEKNAAIRSYGATLIECGNDYDAAAADAAILVDKGGLTLAHSTNNRMVLAGAATATLELLQQVPNLDAIVVAVGGGSLANGAIVVSQALAPNVKVYGVQAATAAAAHNSWHAGERVVVDSAVTMADGLATRSTYDATWPTLQRGLTGFCTVTESQISRATAMMIQHTHNLVEPAAAAAFAGVLQLGHELAGKRVAVFCSGGNIDAATLKQILAV
jgi:threonine dehydratase